MGETKENGIDISGKLFSEKTVVGQYLRYIENLSEDCEEIFNVKYRELVEKKKKSNKGVFLTIVIRTQGKRAEGLREAFLCLEAQIDQNFEVILVGHKVETQNLTVIEKVLGELSPDMREKVTYILVDEGTRSTPINYGFAYANGEYISIFDDDDILFANYVEAFHEGEKVANGKLLHAFTFAQKWKENIESEAGTGYCAIGAPEAKYCGKFNLIEELEENKCPLMSIAFPAYLFNDYGIIFDETLDVTEDWDYIMRVAPMCGVYDVEEPTSIYRLWRNVENSAKLHDQDTWNITYNSIREKMNRHPFLLPSGFLEKGKIGKENSIRYSVGYPRMTGVLFCDLGDGFSDEHFVSTENKSDIPEFELEFMVPDECKNAVRFRIDPGEYGGIILRNCTITVKYYDGTRNIFSTEDCEHNGFADGKDVYFMHYDPMIIWSNTSAVKEIVIKGYVSMEVPEKLIQKAIKEQCDVYAQQYAAELVQQEVVRYQEMYSKSNIVRTLWRRLCDKLSRK